MKVNAYLMFDGNCEAAFKFYEKAVGAKTVVKMTFGDTPMAGEVPPDWKSKWVHARMQVGDQVVMASDAPPGRYEAPKGMSINLSFEQPAEADRIFKALSDGAKVTMPIQETFWAQRFGMLVDKFGVPWMVNCEKQH